MWLYPLKSFCYYCTTCLCVRVEADNIDMQALCVLRAYFFLCLVVLFQNISSLFISVSNSRITHWSLWRVSASLSPTFPSQTLLQKINVNKTLLSRGCSFFWHYMSGWEESQRFQLHRPCHTPSEVLSLASTNCFFSRFKHFFLLSSSSLTFSF